MRAIGDYSEITSSPTLSEAYKLWETKKLRPTYARGTIKQYGSYIDDLINICGNVPVHSICTRLVEDICDDLDEEYSVKGNRMRATISSMYKYLRKVRLVTHNPALGLEYKTELPKQRKLSKVELRQLLEILPESTMHADYKDVIYLVLHLAQRPTETCAMLRTEIDLEDSTWIIGADRTKNKKEHILPLSPAVLDIINRSLTRNKSKLVLSALKGGLVTSYAVRQALKRLMVSNGMTPCSLHDLRRTSAHHMNANGIDSSMIARILNHSQGGVTQKHYIQAGLYDGLEDKKEALLRWSTALARLGTLKKAPY